MSLLTPEGESQPTTGAISRRRVLAGTAWATPVVLLAVATPPAAASTGDNDGVVSLGAGTAQRGYAGFPTLDIQYQALSYEGDGYPVALQVRVAFSSDDTYLPVTINQQFPYGWTVSGVQGQGTSELVFDKDPNVSFQYSVPGLQSWIRAAESAAGPVTAQVLMYGTTSMGGTITGAGSITFSG